jgi:hypothetical protein
MMPRKVIVDGKETTQYDVDNPEDMRLANKLAKQKLAEMEGGQSKEEFEKQAEREEIEGRKLFEGMKKKAQEMYEERGLNAPKIDSEEALTKAIENISRIEKLEENQNPEVDDPKIVEQNRRMMEGAIRYAQGYRGEEQFASVADMIDTLQDRAANNDPVAKAQLEEMLRKWARGMKEQPHQSTFEDRDFKTLDRIRTQRRRRRLQSGNYQGGE